MSKTQMIRAILLRAVAVPVALAVWILVAFMGLSEWSSSGTSLASFVRSSGHCSLP
ncbi:MAG TPA: hypothetical protein VIV60_14285 [Polyangiaceae bacterium]